MDALQLAHQQAEDDGLWFNAKTAAEAYLQTALRKLHAAVEAAPVAIQGEAASDERSVTIKNAHWIADQVHRSEDGPIEALHVVIDMLAGAITPAADLHPYARRAEQQVSAAQKL